MTRVIVHAGFHKTGTSSLQAFLEQNRAALAPHFDYYGKHGFQRAGARAKTYSQRPFWWRRLMFRRAFREFLAGVPDAPLIVISRENFSGSVPGNRRLDGRTLTSYIATVVPLAREILKALQRRFGPDVRVEFLYTLRNRESWIKSLHGHLLRSIRLTEPIDAFRKRFDGVPDLASQAGMVADALDPIQVHTVYLEDFADHTHGPAAAVLDLAGVPEDLRRGLPPAGRTNTGQAKSTSDTLLALNREGGSRAQLRGAKRSVLLGDKSAKKPK